MKNLKSILLVLVLFVGVNTFAGNEKAVIKTSAQCEMCEEKLEASIGALPGVLKVMLNVETKELSVKYNDELISLDEIKTAVTNTGYWADDKSPNKEAYAALDACCKPKKACCAGKTKSSCSKEEAKKECSKDEAAKKSCSKDAAADAEKKACGPGCEKACCADASKTKTEVAPKKSTCTGHTH